MRKTKHTPGPWAIGFSDGSGASDACGYTITAGDHPAIKDTKSVIMVVSSGIDDWGCIYGIKDKANARLIAAAPELLAALERLVSACEKGDPETIAENVVFAKRNIRKAKGE